VKEVVERLVSADLYVRHHISIRQVFALCVSVSVFLSLVVGLSDSLFMEQDEIYIQVGATLTQMLHEATHHMVIQMPVRGYHPARGCIPFHYELSSEFQTHAEYLLH
jgi:hypothetical protein